MLKRGSGVLLHISSVPSIYGIGDFGNAAYQFVDFLHEAGQSYWQVLPLNPTDGAYVHSPYSSHSAFAGNTLFISPSEMAKEGWLSQEDISRSPFFAESQVHYEEVVKYKQKLFDIAYARFRQDGKGRVEYGQFVNENKIWLEDYAVFVVLKEYFNGTVWSKWPMEYRKPSMETFYKFARGNEDKVEKAKFLQFVFFKQWQALRNYCVGKKIQVIGDIPIYVTDDSVDVWRHQSIFKLDEQGNPIFVAGVPPDYFSETGQRWGNPVYDWDALKESGYRWWRERIQHNLKIFDIVRIDHFRGFMAFWQIPSCEKTAVKGVWQPGPGDDFFQTLKKEFRNLPIIAEDLGIITDDVKETMARFEMPGMKVLLFAFGGDLKTHPYIPENYTKNYVAYTGTHDNNTVLGWLAKDASDKEIENIRKYFGKKAVSENLPWVMIKRLMESVADLVIIPVQDILGLGYESRMNVPGTVQGNWLWRLKNNSLSHELAQKLRHLTEISDRT